MKRLILAIQFLTRLPAPRIEASAEDFAASMRWFPLVGLLIGGIVTLGSWAGALIDPRLGALVALLLWAGVTGALHLDGLGDIADGCGAAHKSKGMDREKLLAVLADPHMGSFAVVAIGMQLIAKLVLLTLLIERGAWTALPLVPLAARMGPLFWARWLPPLHEGLGALFSKAIRPVDLMGWSAALALIAILLAAWPLLAAAILIPLWGWWIRRALGGISGDGHGAGIELVESGLLLALLVGTQWG